MHNIKAIITKQNGKPSQSRGFSLSELRAAGLNKQDARKIGIPLDVKRKSSHDQNIASLKAHANDAKARAEAKPKSPESIETVKPKRKAKS